MDIRFAAAALLACLALAGCGDVGLGGPPLSPAQDVDTNDQPLDSGNLDEGTGDVI